MCDFVFIWSESEYDFLMFLVFNNFQSVTLENGLKP